MKVRGFHKLVVIMMFLMGFTLFAKEEGNYFVDSLLTAEAATRKKIVCKVDSLNVREGAGTNFNIVVSEGMPVSMKLDEEADLLSVKDGWYEIRFKFGNQAVTGYVIQDFVEVKEVKVKKKKTKKMDNSMLSAFVNADALRLREDAGTSSLQVKSDDVAVLIRKNEKVQLTGEKKAEDGKKWYKLKTDFSGKTVSGYAISDFITLSVTKKNTVSGMVANKKGLTLKKQASEQSQFVTDKKGKAIKISKGKKLMIIGEVSGDSYKFFEIIYPVKSVHYKGYVSAADISLIFKKAKSPKKTEENHPEITDKLQSDDKKEEQKKEESGKTKDDISTTIEEITSEDQVFKAQKAFIAENETLLYNEPTKTAQVLTDTELKTPIKLVKNQEIIVRKQYSSNGEKWYLVTFKMMGQDGNERIGAGFLPAEKLILTGELVGQTTGFTSKEEEKNEEDFLIELEKEGFPNGYKEKLLELHKKYPSWRFKARHLLLDWEDAIKGESKVGLNLIYNSKNLAWKSLEKGAYNWKTDSFIAFDGSSYVSASEKAIRYYMDPRNFLNENDIYQFELLSYNPEFHEIEGIEAILRGSPMANKQYTYIDDDGEKRNLSFAETFLIAGVYSGVSPYHLASKVKQEVGGGGKFSKSASGDVEGYEGIYNFYNIGANDSTLPLGAVLNGLRFAKNGRKNRPYNDKITFNQYIKLPWDNPYRAILGGAAYIGDNYIGKGQNTLYLEKFNITEFSTFFHQYMSNIEGPFREAAHVKKAYKDLGNLPLVFSIPILENMPEEVSPIPVDEKNPNNWLTSLGVKDYSLTPSFSPVITEYTLVVKKGEREVVIEALPVNKAAEVNGTGVVQLKKKGETRTEISVKAENGNTRTYVIVIAGE